MGSNDIQRHVPVPGEFADTVQSEPPGPAAGRAGAACLPAGESDIEIDIGGGDAENDIAEKPTLSHIGRYALKTLLGEGGLGRVYEAWDPLLSRTVAVKTLQFDLDMPSRIALDRLLLNEARAAANLNHANIVTVFDAGLSAHGVYIAMERLRGRDLRQMLASGWRPTPDLATQIVRRVADALGYAHARGIVHCDIKPGNIFLTRKDKPKVLDFGIARATTASARPDAEQAIAGSPYYLSPEQLQGGVIDARTDIYGLGVVLYELLTGQKPFRGDSLQAIHAAVLAGQAPPAHELCADVPPALSEVCARAMDPNPESRPACAAELSQALRQWASTNAEPAAEQASGTRRISRRVVGALGLLTLALATLGWGLQARRSAVDPDAGTRSARGALSAVDAPAAAPPVPIPSTAAAAQVPAPAAPLVAAADPPALDAAVAARPVAKPVPRAAATRPRAAAAAAATPAAAADIGLVQIAVTPWGEVEVDGRPAGTTPPLTRLTLPVGAHTITVRNADFAPYAVTVQVDGDKPAVVRHRFGS